MVSHESIRHIQLKPDDNHRLAILAGQFDDNLRFIERHLGVEINNRGNDFEIIGKPGAVDCACDALTALYEKTAQTDVISHQDIQLQLKTTAVDHELGEEEATEKFQKATLFLKKTTIQPRTLNQCHLINAIRKNDICFGVGPSGTGKTFLAVACAVAAFEREEVSRIVLVRPAVEAGESLGFLPGDLAQKIDPYLKPLYDALSETMGVTAVTKLSTQGVIEVAPLAFMRGRTLNDSFVILDEGQNSTRDQMKMFLTRIGFGSKAVITGDITQVDLPKHVQSGLRHAITLLKGIEGIQFSFFSSADVVRHNLVQQIIEAYEHQG